MSAASSSKATGPATPTEDPLDQACAHNVSPDSSPLSVASDSSLSSSERSPLQHQSSGDDCVEENHSTTTARALSSPRKKTRHETTSDNIERTGKPIQGRHRRKSTRGTTAAIEELAYVLVQGEKRVVIVTGAGLSAASGVRPFRTHVGNTQLANPKHHGVLPTTAGLWNNVIWTTATRQAFRKNPLQWYTDFWIPHFLPKGATIFYPNMGHMALEESLQEFGDRVTQITQNIDGLQPPSPRLVEAHGRTGLYKCVPNADSDTDEESDDDATRQVHLGHRRKSRLIRERRRRQELQLQQHQQELPPPPFKSSTSTGSFSSTSSTATPSSSHNDKTTEQKEEEDDTRITTRNTTRKRQRAAVCPYSFEHSLTATQLEPKSARRSLVQMEKKQPFQHKHHHQAKSRRKNDSDEDNTDSEDSDADNDDSGRLKEAPRCPNCGNHVLPQALLFDEGYHSHAHYQFERMEEVLAEADVLVFCGTSFSVHLTVTALNVARDRQLPVYNFNVHDSLAVTPRLNVINILGPAQETLPQLMRTCRDILAQQERQQQQTGENENGDADEMGNEPRLNKQEREAAKRRRRPSRACVRKRNRYLQKQQRLLSSL